VKIRAIRVNRFFFFHPHFFRHTPRMGQAVAAILVFAGASFFFALAETALFSLGKWQVAQLAQKKSTCGQNRRATARTTAGFAGDSGGADAGAAGGVQVAQDAATFLLSSRAARSSKGRQFKFASRGNFSHCWRIQ
jgi:hypothetical protein